MEIFQIAALDCHDIIKADQRSVALQRSKRKTYSNSRGEDVTWVIRRGTKASSVGLNRMSSVPAKDGKGRARAVRSLDQASNQGLVLEALCFQEVSNILVKVSCPEKLHERNHVSY